MGLGDYAEKLRGVYDGLTGADERDNEVAVGFGPTYDDALEDAEDRLPTEGEIEQVDEYEGGALDLSGVTDEMPVDELEVLGTDELTVAVLEYEVTAEPEPETSTRSRGAGAAGDHLETGSSGPARLDYDQ